MSNSYNLFAIFLNKRKTALNIFQWFVLHILYNTFCWTKIQQIWWSFYRTEFPLEPLSGVPCVKFVLSFWNYSNGLKHRSFTKLKLYFSNSCPDKATTRKALCKCTSGTASFQQREERPFSFYSARFCIENARFALNTASVQWFVDRLAL